MINNYIAENIERMFPYALTDEQVEAVSKLSDFLVSGDNKSLFILRGYAGTGKTLLVSAVVKVMAKFEMKAVLLAPTGRAAKVFTAYSGFPAYTIHKWIYRQESFSGVEDNYALNFNKSRDTLFIIDEASMISNNGLSGTMFGSGRLLDDMLQFVYSGKNCKVLLVGDVAQLPPIGEEESPALVADKIRSYGFDIDEFDLVKVVRQTAESGILWNATNIRRLIEAGQTTELPKIRIKGFANICRLSGEDFVDTLSACYDKDGMDETVVICRSNKRANIYNRGIRAQIFYREEELESGDILMVAKNNYFWTENEKDMDFIANGENVIVKRFLHKFDLYGFHFADVTLCFPNYNDREMEVTILLDTLLSDAPALSSDENNKLFYAVLEDYTDVSLKRDRMNKMRSDIYYNALQVKYSYAITCHKAQGGQWKNVFLDQVYMPKEYLTKDYFRWLYTAFTRATDTLYLINYPENQIE